MFFHHKVSTYFGGHLMHQSTQQQKVRGNSRLLSNDILVADNDFRRQTREGPINCCHLTHSRV
ncbi:hypothetical protein J2Z50_005368 [Ensifer mexicanus]|nr:hypothetical protein [Sinorhizobium mexicanum]